MSHYRTSLRDIEFMLFEVLRRDEVLGTGPFADVDSTTARDILTEVDRLAREEIAASYNKSDRTPPTRDPDTGDVRLPERIKASYQALIDTEGWRRQLPDALGGQRARTRPLSRHRRRSATGAVQGQLPGVHGRGVVAAPTAGRTRGPARAGQPAVGRRRTGDRCQPGGVDVR